MVVSLYEDPMLKVGSSGSLFVSVYRATTSLASLDQLEKYETQHSQANPKFSTLSVITQVKDLVKVDDAVRARGVELSNRFEASVRGSAIVVSVHGLTAVIIRSFLSAFFLLSKSSMPIKTFSNLEDALAWLRALPGQDTELKTDLRLLKDLQDFTGVK